MKTSACLLAAMLVAGPTWGATSSDTQAPAAPPAASDAVTIATAVDETAAIPAPTSAECHCAPAGSPVELEIGEPLSSATRKRGDPFAIRLHTPITRDGVVLIPAGITGAGEVVHADRSHGGGKPGELLIAARYLELEGKQVPLRGLKFGAQGKDNSYVAIGVAIAIGVLAQFIHGREIVIPAGTLVSAKLAQDFPQPITAPAATDSGTVTTPPANPQQQPTKE